MSNTIEIKFLDHVAIRVHDMNVSAKWYENMLGLKQYKLKKWDAYPIFMLAGKSGIALFPANLKDESLIRNSDQVGIDHYAFHVDKENFDKAIRKYESLGMDFEVKDHHYFKSVYTEDPDRHTVELTCLNVDEDEIYK